MKGYRILRSIGIFFIIVLLFGTLTSQVPLNTATISDEITIQPKSKQDTDSAGTKCSNTGVPTTFVITDTATQVPRTKMETIPLISSFTSHQQNNGEDFPVFSLGYDCQNPALVSSDETHDILVLSEANEFIEVPSILGRWAIGGYDWASEGDITGWFFGDTVKQPRIDYYGFGNSAWGTITPGQYGDGIVYYLEFPNITDPYDPGSNSPEGWTAWSVDWGQSQGYAHFDSADVACYAFAVPGIRFFGVIALTGDSPSRNGAQNNTIIITFFNEYGSVIFPFTDLPCDCTKIACEIDQSIGRLYIVCEYENHPQFGDGSLLIYHDITGNDDWYLGEWPGYYFEGLCNPSITVDDHSVFVVGEMIRNNHTDITCQYSPDAGETFAQYDITCTPDDDEVYPCVSAGYVLFPTRTVNTKDIICSFIRHGDLFVSYFWRQITWWEELPEPLNDVENSVVEQYGSISADMFITWTDHRYDTREIYFDYTLYYEYSWPELAIDHGFCCNITADIISQSTTTRYVNWTIRLDGGILWTKREITGFIQEIPQGSRETIGTGRIFGFGIITVTIDAAPWYGNHATAKTHGLALGPFVYIFRI